MLLFSIVFIKLFAMQAEAQSCISEVENIKVYKSLGEALKEPDSVKVLVLRRNRFRDFPEEIYSLTNLVKIDISRNRISEIPEGIGNLKNLCEVNFSRNRINSLPDTFENLKNLKIINLSDNKIEYLPEFFFQLKQLERLDIFSNPVKINPKEIIKLSETIKYLDIRNTYTSDFDRQEISELLKNTEIKYTRSCNCH